MQTHTCTATRELPIHDGHCGLGPQGPQGQSAFLSITGAMLLQSQCVSHLCSCELQHIHPSQRPQYAHPLSLSQLMITERRPKTSKEREGVFLPRKLFDSNNSNYHIVSDDEIFFIIMKRWVRITSLSTSQRQEEKCTNGMGQV